MVINVKQSVHSMLLTGWLKTRVHSRDHNHASVKRDSGQSQCRNIVRSEYDGTSDPFVTRSSKEEDAMKSLLSEW